MEFKKVKLGECVDYILDYRGKTPKKSKTGIPTLSAKSVKNNFIDYDEVYYISRDEYNRFMSKGFPRIGDILMTMEAPLGLVATLDRDDVGLGQRIVTIRGKKDFLDNNYLKFYLQSPKGQHELYSRATGTTVVGISQKNLKNIDIVIPSLENQIRIGRILNNYNIKIEINNKIISNLESQAQAIFKSWFVDFEPFQDGDFVESELGMIPEGWEVKPIGELLDFDIGGGWGKEKPQEKYLIPAYVIRGTDIPNSKLGYFNMDNYRYHTESNLKNRRLQVGDIIFESSGGSTNQDLGRMLLVTDELLNEYNNDIICASFCKLIRINDSSIRWFVYNLLEYSYKNKILTKYEVKSTGISNFSFTIFKDDFKIAVPNRKTMERYFNVTGNNINLSAKLGVQNTKLAELRDALLPKLMAGEIDVSNIKIEGEEVKNE